MRLSFTKHAFEAGRRDADRCDRDGRAPQFDQHRGVALIITLIMLSVITIMAVAFLSLSRRERFAVQGAMEQTDAHLAAEAAQQRALSEIVALIKANTNWLAADLLVSRNLINPAGFLPGISHPTNVNYDFVNGGGPLDQDNLLQNITNLWIDARLPVFINTNKAGVPPGPLDFRFYVDLNRNGRFETNGFFIPFGENRQNIPNANPEFHVGDPEWLALFERPTLNHSSSNRAFGRYAYLVQPIGKALDLNFIHNDGRRFMDTNTANNFDSGFHRNQGFGTWEINLAAFLATINTNLWPVDPSVPQPYRYITNATPTRNSGTAFWDATDLLRYRYNGLDRLYPAQFLLPSAVWTNFLEDQIDGYANSPVAPFGQPLPEPPNEPLASRDDYTRSWPGSCSTPVTHFYTPHDLVRVPATYPFRDTGFWERVSYLTRSNSSYARHTFYRMVDQLGTDSAPEPQWAEVRKLRDKIGATNAWDFPAEPIGRFNLNYDNVYDPDYPAAPLVQPLGDVRQKFFTNLANVLIRSQFDFGITNIPLYPTNWYTPEVHRLLQVAANILDATSPLPNGFPSVFRPNVGPDPNNPSGYAIVGFEFDNEKQSLVNSLRTNVFGIPMVIGARKGIPNFNEYVVQTTALGARKIEVTRDTPASRSYTTNQMFVLGISNFFGLEAWNSYTNSLNTNFPALSDVTMEIGIVADLVVTNNETPSPLFFSNRVVFTVLTNILTANWEGFRPSGPDGGFKVPIYTNVMLLTNSAYKTLPRADFYPIGFNNFDEGAGFPAPEWTYSMSNRLTYILHSGNQVLDFVYLDRLTNTVNLSQLFIGPSRVSTEPTGVAGSWNTNRLGGATAKTIPTLGILKQLTISVGDETLGDTDWRSFAFSRPANVNVDIGKFRAFLGLPPRYPFPASTNNDLKYQAPFSPARRVVQTINWQVNDPLVHHMVEHMTDRDPTNNITTVYVRPFDQPVPFPTNLSILNQRYRPWNGNPAKNPSEDPLATHLGVKDPGVFKSDDWDFPTNKLPSIGWLGRVHRGTPWQTVYMKADVASEAAWRENVWDPLLKSHPTNDWQLIDMFTVAVHPNASRGQLSINQTNEAAWAAVLGGVFTLTNQTLVDPEIAKAGMRTNLGNAVIEPGSPQLRAIVDGINRTRTNMQGQVFRRLGDILQVPELSVQFTNALQQPVNIMSPYLDLTKDPNDYVYGINDAAYERIPQQILSLLRVGDPRYVIYAFGQSLKPADRSIMTGGPYFGVCTNYQITGEVVTRTVVRLEGEMRSPRAVIEAFNVVPID